MSKPSRTAENILAELETVVAEAERVMAQAGTMSSDIIGALRDRYELAVDRMGSLYATTRKKVVSGARQTDAAIRENPYTSVGLALAVGVAAGLLLSRDKSHDHD